MNGNGPRIVRYSGNRPPDFFGAGVGEERWRAWRVGIPPLGQRGDPAFDAELGMWLLFCPGAHLAWSYWWINLIHLRPIEGTPPPQILAPGNGWEMLCGAQQPDIEPDPDRREETVRFLQPFDWQVQFGAVKSDHEAERVAAACVREIMRGQVSPDQDFRSFWGRTIPATAAHYAAGAHPEPS